MIYLNKRLIESQNLTMHDVNALTALHIMLKTVFDKVEDMTPSEVDDNRDEIVSVVEDLELEMQRVWHFPQSKAHHTWWVRVPQCTCPTMDNLELMGVDQRIHTASCLLHGRKHWND